MVVHASEIRHDHSPISPARFLQDLVPSPRRFVIGRPAMQEYQQRSRCPLAGAGWSVKEGGLPARVFGAGYSHLRRIIGGRLLWCRRRDDVKNRERGNRNEDSQKHWRTIRALQHGLYMIG